ncbi:Flp family type IVb pilin [Syntrophorhabdus aromaticivorans]|uniref:Flp family type IVb pilin n=1 Tax=Syntrophorhabdus aromaticivorans TaxID=328301 RepID=UPI000413237B|nr:Flp family type IVb pilin [Syntrophorhabdus aromaticivorans]
MESVKRFFREEEGVTAIEYGLIAALVAVAIIAALVALGGGLTNIFNKVTEQLQ